jgi:hypothetical protein
MRLVPLAAVLVLSSLSSLSTGVAAADGFYYTESVGAGHVKDELARYMPDAFVRIRLSLGIRRGNWALEGFFAGNLNSRTQTTAEGDGAPTVGSGGGGGTSLVGYGLDLKYMQPLSEHFSVYLRGSLGRGVLDRELADYSGRSAGFGAGVQLKGKVRALGFLWWPLFFTGIGPKVTAGLFLDDGYDFYRLHEHGDADKGRAIDAKVTYMTLGFSVGSDF